MVYAKGLGGFKYPASGENLRKMMPFFFNDLDWIGNISILEKVVSGIVDAVKKAEEKFDQSFGGWYPASNQFGIAPLRPLLIGKTDCRWIWTDSASATSNWSAEDSFIASHALLTDELILIYGYFNLEPVPNILEIWIQPGSEKMPIWNVEQMRVSGKGYIIFPEPLIIEPRSQFAVLAATRGLTTQVVEEAGLLGYQFCPKAKLITKEPTA
jgi:hypothetical protein